MKRVLTMILLIMVLLLTSCSNKNNKTEVSKKEYQIYYIDSKSSGIVSEGYSPDGQTKDELVKELLGVLQEDPKNMIYKKAIPDNITIKDYNILDNQLIINFDSNYSQLVGIPEVLCRATVVKTVSQISGIDFVLFNVNGQALIDSNGVQAGLMTSESFIENTAAETNYKVTLYFANEAGDLLKTTTRNIFYTDTAPIEELVVNQLISGSTEMGLYSTIPDGTTLLNISTKERICYVDFNEKFLESIPEIKDEVVIYSVVNSLVELPGINKVQFRINGQIVDAYNNTPFDVLFERNLSINEDNQ